MKVRHDAAWRAFGEGLEGRDGATRIKRVRDTPLKPGGRAKLSLFEKVEGGRPHPRMRVDVPAIEDAGARSLIEGVEAPEDEASLVALIETLSKEHAAYLRAEEVAAGPAGSERFPRNHLSARRRVAFFAELEAALAGWGLSEARYALKVAEEFAFAGRVDFDDHDTGTYHSYGHDEPFVHYLEAFLEGLPEEGGEAMAVLPGDQQEALRRSRTQARAHLDHLMRHKYSNHVVVEQDAERTLGGFLIDRQTRRIVSETPESAEALVPSYELLRVDPAVEHPFAGAWVHRDGAGGLRDADFAEVEASEEQLRRSPIEAERLTLRRAPEHEKLRPEVRLDWNGDGYVQAGEVEWVSWAGHCDIKAIMEQVGVTVLGAGALREWRSDTQGSTEYSEAYLREMVAAVMELGSIYLRVDGSGAIKRGVHRFGGARNDSRPDRLQFLGEGPGKSFRWPLGGRRDAFVVEGIEGPDGPLDPKTVFFRWLPDSEALTIEANPRYMKTIEGDYNLLDVTGLKLKAKVRVDRFDDKGYPTHGVEPVELDLGATEGRVFLGTWMEDAAKRRVFRVYLDRAQPAIVAELDVFEAKAGKWEAVPRPAETVLVPLVAPLNCTLSREMKRDDPGVFQTLLDQALRHGQNICADTDSKAAVWNGVVTSVEAERKGHNPETRVERWKVGIEARFGSATLDYLLQRDARGEPEAWCPVLDERAWGGSPDFLWQDFPDVGSKGVEDGVWVINRTMLQRDVVTTRHDPSVPGEIYVEDEYIKSLYELIFCGLGGYPFTIVHQNKRYGFTDEAAWKAAIAHLEQLREALEFIS